MRLRSIGLLSVLALVFASCGGAVPEASGPSEGIQVHGDWTIDVYDEDGTLDQHVEFSNALTSGGSVMATLLGGSPVHGEANEPFVEGWGIAVGAVDGSSPCDSDLSSLFEIVTVGCLIHLTSSEGNLEVTVNGDVLTLEGTVEATQPGIIDFAESVIGLREEISTGGGVNTSYSFSGTSVAPQTVDTGQVIQVIIDFSFTSG